MRSGNLFCVIPVDRATISVVGHQFAQDFHEIKQPERGAVSITLNFKPPASLRCVVT